MKLHRIYGIILRYFYLFRRSFDRLSDAFYWPTIDLLLWGLTSTYLRSYVPNASQIILVIISGILFWIIVWRGQYEVTVNLLEDLWNNNLINIFAAPLKFSEWVASFMIIGLVKALISFAFAMLMAFVLYQINIFYYGFYFVPFIILLLMSGWSVGFLVSAVILRYGTKLQTLAWTSVMAFSPFCGIYYPISILPQWAQFISKFVAPSYVFEGSRQIIATGTLDPQGLLICFGLNCVYIILALLLLRASYHKVLDKGMVNLY